MQGSLKLLADEAHGGEAMNRAVDYMEVAIPLEAFRPMALPRNNMPRLLVFLLLRALLHRTSRLLENQDRAEESTMKPQMSTRLHDPVVSTAEQSNSLLVRPPRAAQGNTMEKDGRLMR